jgi:hypothetical protein
MSMYSGSFKLKVMCGFKLYYKKKLRLVNFFLKLCQMNWNVVGNNVSVVVDELPSQITFYTCLTIDIWTRRPEP